MVLLHQNMVWIYWGLGNRPQTSVSLINTGWTERLVWVVLDVFSNPLIISAAYLRVCQTELGATSSRLHWPLTMYAFLLAVVTLIWTSYLGHRFDYNTPIEETVSTRWFIRTWLEPTIYRCKLFMMLSKQATSVTSGWALAMLTNVCILYRALTAWPKLIGRYLLVHQMQSNSLAPSNFGSC